MQLAETHQQRNSEKMELLNEKIRNDGFYSVGFNPLVEQYIMIVIICHWFWFERYYLISKEEYEWFDSAIQNWMVQPMIAINKELNIPGFIALNWNVRIQQNKKRILKILLINSKPTE